MKTYLIFIAVSSFLHYTVTDEPCKGLCEIFWWSNPKPCRGCVTSSSSTNFQYSKSSSVAVQVPITMTTPTEISTEPSTTEISTIKPETTTAIVIIPEQNNDTKGRDCYARCPVTAEEDPVCGTDNVTYGNIWKLRCAKMCGVDVEFMESSACRNSDENFASTISAPEITTVSSELKYIRCIKTCPTGAEYNLVCGTDMETYVNIVRLKCAQSCGRAVEFLCEGPCPVCAPLITNTTTTLRSKTD